MFRKTSHSLILRISLLYAMIVACTITLMGGAILWLFNESSERILNNHLMAYTDIIISHVKTKDGRIVLQEDAKLLIDLPRYWQLSSKGGNLYKSKNLSDWIPVLPEGTGHAQRITWHSNDGKNIIALQTTFIFPDNQKITLISGLDAEVAEAYKRQERAQLATPLYRILLIAGMALITLCILLAYSALRPIASIKTGLQSIREGKAQRIEGTYPREIKVLTDEINHLLDYTSGSIARHREFSSNLAHSLKTPLTVIANESDIGVIKTRLRQLMDIIDRNLSRAYAAGTSHILSATTPILPILTDIGEGFAKVHGKQVEIDYPANLYFKGDQADLYEVLGNIIENACKFSKSLVRISNHNSDIVVEDDGPGIPPSQYTAALKRGTRLDENTPGTGIGLAVASDIIALYHGNIRLEASELSGLKVVISLPALG